MIAVRRLSVLMVTGMCLAGCGGSDTSQPNPPAATQASPAPAPTTMPNPDAWRTPSGLNPTTQPAAPAATQEIEPPRGKDAGGPIHDADNIYVRQLIAQIYAQLKVNDINGAQAILDKINKIRLEKALADPIRMIEIPDAESAILTARAYDVMGAGSTQPAK